MPDITSLFQGSDGATKANFNQKITDINAHGNNAAAHITTATHTRTGTVNNLSVPEGARNLIFLATADLADGDTWTVNGQPTTAVLQNGEALPGELFKAGCWVQFIYDADANQLNFSAGGSKQTPAAYAGKLTVSVAAYDGGSVGGTKVRIKNESLGMDLSYTPDALGKVTVELTGNKTYSITLIDVPEPYYGEAATQYIGFDSETVLSLQLKGQPDVIGFRVKVDGIFETIEYIEGAVGWNNMLLLQSGEIDPGSFENSWIIKDIKPCVLNQGVVQYYFKNTGFCKFDYTLQENGLPANTDGTDGDVMIEFPRIYTSVLSETIGGNQWINFRFSKEKLDGYSAFPWMNTKRIEQETMYIAAYEGFVQGAKLRSCSNVVPSFVNSLNAAVTYSAAAGSGYYTVSYVQYQFLSSLLTMLFRTRSVNSNPINARGLTDSSFSSVYKTGSLNASPLFAGASDNQHPIKFCGIENLWGNGIFILVGFYNEQGSSADTPRYNINTAPPFTRATNPDLTVYTSVSRGQGGVRNIGSYGMTSNVIWPSSTVPSTVRAHDKTYQESGTITYGVSGLHFTPYLYAGADLAGLSSLGNMFNASSAFGGGPPIKAILSFIPES